MVARTVGAPLQVRSPEILTLPSWFSRWIGRIGALAVLVLVAATASALEVPALKARVNDLANLISDPTERELEATLAAYERKTGHQLAVLTVPSLGGDPIEDFSIRVVEAWKLGRARQDDGVLVLVAAEDRKMRIEVGYGLEGDVPDAIAGRIVHDLMAPRFRQGDYDGGIVAAVRAILDRTGGEGIGPEGSQAPARRRDRGGGGLVMLILFIVTLLSLLGGRRGRRGGGMIFFGGLGGGGYRGGGFGGFGGGGGGFGGGGGGFGGGGASGNW